VDSTELPNTVVTAHLREPIPNGKNLVYCASFQLAWNALADDVIGEDVQLVNGPPWVSVLHERLVDGRAVDEDSVVAMAGFGKDDILGTLNRKLRKKFGNAAPELTQDSFDSGPVHPDDILVYAFLLKDLAFAEPFERLRKPVDFHFADGRTSVEAFGVNKFSHDKEKHNRIAEQVKVLAYDYPSSESVVEVELPSGEDQLILAAVPPGETLLDTIMLVNERIDEGISVTLQHKDCLAVPLVHLGVRHSYQELVPVFLANKGYTGYFIAESRQDILFSLTEQGVALRSFSWQVLRGAPKRLVFDSPFLLMLRRKGREMPYFALWVANPEILVPME